MSRLNILRYGSLREVQDHADGDVPMSDTELRALVLNLLDNARVQQKEINELHERLPVEQ